MKDEKVYIGAIISDIHFGAMSASDLLNELEESFLKHLKSLKILDYVIIAGDLFDSKLSLNSDHTKNVFIFMKKLIDICNEKNTKIRIIRGTESHDNAQLNILKFFNTKINDIKVIETVTSEELFPNFKVLYIPEEYIQNQEEYYKEYFNKTYDAIFGHGMVNEVAFVAKSQESEMTMNKAPIFKSKDLLNISIGPVFFGHIHTTQCINERFFYCGSFSRWVFGEEAPKGFYMFAYTPKTGKYKVEFIENKLANKYITVKVEDGSALYKIDHEKQLEYILDISKRVDFYKLRIIFNIPETYENPALLTSLITDIFAKQSNIKVIINNNSKEILKKKENEEKIKNLLTSYGFIFDKSVDIEDKICRFIKIKNNKDISVKKMRKYLYEKINT